MKNWASGKLLGFDLETTGVDTAKDRPVSFALLYYENKELRKTDTRVVNPGMPIPAGAMAVHGITDEVAKTGLDLKDAVSHIASELVAASAAGVPVVGMNVSFDISMINSASEQLLGKSLVDMGWRGPVCDVLVIDRHEDKYRKGRRQLINLCEHYGINPDTLHDAANDTAATVEVFFKQLDKYKAIANLEPEELHAKQVLWYRDWATHTSSYFVSQGKPPFLEEDLCWPVRGVLPEHQPVSQQASQRNSATKI